MPRLTEPDNYGAYCYRPHRHDGPGKPRRNAVISRLGVLEDMIDRGALYVMRGTMVRRLGYEDLRRDKTDKDGSLSERLEGR